MMAEGAQRERWGRQSAALAMMANCNRDPKRHASPYKPSEFDPFHNRPIQGSVEDLKALLGG
jgi:hypothetical protein